MRYAAVCITNTPLTLVSDMVKGVTLPPRRQCLWALPVQPILQSDDRISHHLTRNLREVDRGTTLAIPAGDLHVDEGS